MPKPRSQQSNTAAFTMSALVAIAIAICIGIGGHSTNARADQIDDALGNNDAYVAGIKALSENKNAVAALRLREAAAMELTAASKLRVLARIAEAEVRQDKFEEALAVFEQEGLAETAEASYWHALALIGTGESGEADKVLAAIVTDQKHPQWNEASLSRCSLLLRFGATEEAIKVLQPIIESKRAPYAARAKIRAAEIRLGQGQLDEAAALLAEFESAPEADLPRPHQLGYLRARLAIKKKDWPGALAELDKLAPTSPESNLPPNIRDGAIIALARAQHNSNEPDQAIRTLRGFISGNPGSPNLPIALGELQKFGLFESEIVDPQLLEWSGSDEKNLAASAGYYLALSYQKAAKPDLATAALEVIRKQHAEHPIAPRALLQLSEIYVSNADKPQALEVLADLRELTENPKVLARIAFIEARADYAAADFKLAADKFAAAANADRNNAEYASFNSAIAALRSGDLASFDQRVQLIESIAPKGSVPLSTDLALERALAAARDKKPDAVELINAFLNDNPDHLRRAEALLALASLQLTRFTTPNTVSARKAVADARKTQLSAALAEEADYVSFWIEVSDNKNDAAITTAELFIEKHPKSPRAPEILYKLGEIHYRDGSFTEAQRHYERLALDFPTSPRAEVALFTAGRAAMRTGTQASTDSAFAIFSRVADLGGPFATHAKLQQALVRRSQLKEEDAIDILNALLAENLKGELYFSTLTTKGESLLVLGQDDPSRIQSAITVFDKMARHKDASQYWIHQALTRKGNALERAGKSDAALVAYEKVISAAGEKPRAGQQPRDYVWLYKSGFAAIRLYKEKKNWKAAINIADTLAATDGPDAQVARKLSEELATKNFIWRD